MSGGREKTTKRDQSHRPVPLTGLYYSQPNNYKGGKFYGENFALSQTT